MPGAHAPCATKALGASGASLGAGRGRGSGSGAGSGRSVASRRSTPRRSAASRATGVAAPSHASVTCRAPSSRACTYASTTRAATRGASTPSSRRRPSSSSHVAPMAARAHVALHTACLSAKWSLSLSSRRLMRASRPHHAGAGLKKVSKWSARHKAGGPGVGWRAPEDPKTLRPRTRGKGSSRWGGRVVGSLGWRRQPPAHVSSFTVRNTAHVTVRPTPGSPRSRSVTSSPMRSTFSPRTLARMSQSPEIMWTS